MLINDLDDLSEMPDKPKQPEVTALIPPDLSPAPPDLSPKITISYGGPALFVPGPFPKNGILFQVMNEAR
jgi:hypothetical protein